MIADEGALDRIQLMWNMFYHFYLDQSSHSLLLHQCNKLIDASETLEAWSNSQYGQFLHVCTTHTLSELRRHWNLYAQTERFTEKERMRFKDAFTVGARTKLASTLEDGTNIQTACRSAGPLWLATSRLKTGAIGESVRIGITRNVACKLRFYERGNPYVSGPKRLGR